MILQSTSQSGGARRVIAFEPYPYSYDIAKKNVSLNKIKSVLILNQGVGDKNKIISIPRNFENTAGSNLKSFDKGKKIRIVTLRSIAKKYGITDGVLKMDCEGCEYRIILNSSNETLRHFKQMVVECHYGYLNIEKKLKNAGFEVKHSRVYYSYNKSAENKQMIMNLIWAKLFD